MSDDLKQPNYIDLAADIVSAYVSKNSVPQADLPALIHSVHTALSQATQGATEASKEELTPAVPIKKSITPDYLICLETARNSNR